MKKHLIIICALLILTAFASCGDSNSSLDDSEVMESSISETTTEEETEPKTSTEKDDLITVPNLYGMDCDEALKKYKDTFAILSSGREESELEAGVIVSQDIEAGTTYEAGGNRPRIRVKLSNGKKAEPESSDAEKSTPLSEQTLDKTYKSDGIAFDYCSEWKEYDSQFWAPAFTIKDNFRVITCYQTGEFGNISNEKYIEQKKQEFDEKNRPYEIVTNKNGYEIFSYLQTNFIKCYGCANGKAVFTIEFKNYSEEYDDIVNKIIDSIQIVSYGMSNPMKSETEKSTETVTEKTTEKATEPPTEKLAETKSPAIETTSVQTTVHFILNLDTSCIHINPDCSAAQKITPENYSTVDIAESDLENYNGTYWACGKCCPNNYRQLLPKF